MSALPSRRTLHSSVPLVGASRSESPPQPSATTAVTVAPPAQRRPHPGWALLVPALALLVLEAVVRAGLAPAHLIPPPSALLATLRELAGADLAWHVGASAVRVAIGYALGAALGILAGALVGLDRRAAALLDPTFQALRAVPSLAWVPLLLLWLGIDEAPKLVLIAIGAFFPVYMGTAAGIRGVDRRLVEVGRMVGLRGAALARRVLLPAALPSLLTGLRNGLSLAWMFMVAAELIAASRGLGYLLSDGRETGRADIVLCAILLLALLGKASDSVVQALERRLLVWHDSLERSGT